MIETELYKYMQDNVTATNFIYWGKIDRDAADPRKDVVISFFKTPSLSSQLTPSYLDVFQISIFSNRIDTATSCANEVMGLFQLQTLVLDTYRCWVNNITNQGSIYDEEDIVQVILNLELKYTGL